MKNHSWVWLGSPLVLLFALGFLLSFWEEQGVLPRFLADSPATSSLKSLSGWFSDQKLKSRGPVKPKQKIVLIGIDTESIAKLGRWPWHRDTIAKILERVMKFKPKVIGMDLIAPERDLRLPPELGQELKSRKLESLVQRFETDPLLIKTVQTHADRIVLGMASEQICQPLIAEEGQCPVHPSELSRNPKLDLPRFAIEHVQKSKNFNLEQSSLYFSKKIVTHFPELHAVTRHLGLFDTVQDPDGITRRTVLFKFVDGVAIPSFALRVASVATSKPIQLQLNDSNKVESLGFVGDPQPFPATELGKLEINFRGKSDLFPILNAKDLLDDSPRAPVLTNPESGLPFPCSSCQVETLGFGKPVLTWTATKADILKDAIVLIGVTDPLYDVKPLPLSPLAPGVVTHAMIIDNLLSGDALTPMTRSSGWLICLLLITLGALGFRSAVATLASTQAFLVSVGTLALLWFLDFKVLYPRAINWNTGLIHIEYFSIAVITLINRYALEEKRRKFIKEAFSRYVSPRVVDRILEDPKMLALGGSRRDLTILFADIRNFMPLSEKLDAQTLQAFLKDYHNIITKIVIEKGTLDKYIGDSVMAFWGAPLEQSDHALNACRASVDILRALNEAKPYFKEKYDADVGIGIGLNSGPVSVGNMGSELVFSYTVVGDNVNLASRVERLTRYFGANILTTRATLDSILHMGQALPPHRVLDFVKVVGSKQAVEIIQLLDADYPSEALAAYREGRTLYAAREWEQAALKFKLAHDSIRAALQIEDGPSQVLLSRCRIMKMTPPPAHWDGSWEMASK